MLSFDQFADLVDAGLKRKAPERGIHDIRRHPDEAATWRRNNATARIAPLSEDKVQPLSLFFYVGPDVVETVIPLSQTAESADEASTRIIGHVASWGEPAGGA
jgi:hypothetical protein